MNWIKLKSLNLALHIALPLKEPPASINQALIKKPVTFIGNIVSPPKQKDSGYC
jgi:hypothetical protein